MSDDLVAMLRIHFSADMKHEYPQTCLIEYEYERQKASDRIEKLEAALRKIKDLYQGPEDDDVVWMRDCMTYKIVCDTLEGKDN